MKVVDTEETILIVTGTELTAEDRDRPLAYWLKQQIDQRGVGHPWRKAVVVGDAWYLANRVFHLNPTVAVGGPGANAVAQQFASALPVVWKDEDEQAFIQLDFDDERKRAALWGMNAAATASAVEGFVIHGQLDELLRRIWKFRMGMTV
ncbi:MAG TPA: hypothetical protein VFS40_09815 [Gemmatimonadales bacterium]|nr:hypothetical protein [Gemmatimonadales bacterium]